MILNKLTWPDPNSTQFAIRPIRLFGPIRKGINQEIQEIVNGPRVSQLVVIRNCIVKEFKPIET